MYKKTIISVMLGFAISGVYASDERVNAEVVTGDWYSRAFYLDGRSGSYGFYNDMKNPIIFSVTVSPISEKSVILKCMHYVSVGTSDVPEEPTVTHKVAPGERAECITKNMALISIDSKGSAEGDSFALGMYSITEKKSMI